MGETFSVSTEQWTPPHQQSSRRLNHPTLGGMKATKAKLQSTLKRQIDLFHSHSCFSQGIPPEPPCSFYAPASTNQAADESIFLDQSFEVSLDQQKNLLLEGGAPGRGKRKIHHPPSFPHLPWQSFGSPASKSTGLENKLFKGSDHSFHCISLRAAKENTQLSESLLIKEWNNCSEQQENASNSHQQNLLWFSRGVTWVLFVTFMQTRAVQALCVSRLLLHRQILSDI